MARSVLMAALVACSLAATAAPEESEAAGLGEAYVGVSGAMVLPPGGSRMRRLGGAEAHAGVFMSECIAAEAVAGWMENCASLAVRGLVRFCAFDLYDRYFGYSRFDPFFTFGARGWLGSCGQVGPQAGIGAMYHLTDDWSLRLDAGATLGLDSEVEVVHSLSIGVQHAF
jgi:hypothetical protein